MTHFELVVDFELFIESGGIIDIKKSNAVLAHCNLHTYTPLIPRFLIQCSRCWETIHREAMNPGQSLKRDERLTLKERESPNY